MKINTFLRNPYLVAIVMFSLTTGCGGGGERQSTTDESLRAQPTNSQGRLLASNCFQCHGTGGSTGFEDIRGGEADEIREFLSRPPSSNIMAAHAQGYTPAQIEQIINYFRQR